ncbi:MAG TPA: AMP-binding protein [Mycolicibacterium fallax]|nr:AMP-binding protein [Mycolicibacterium fallax]
MGATLGEALAVAAAATPERVLLVDGDVQLDAATLYRQSLALAGALRQRFPAGSTVSFMLPNWHEAAVIYLGAGLAGMVVNPVLPSLREHELSFVLADAGSVAIFIPGDFRGHDYPGMLDRVAAQLPDPPEVVVVRGDGHTAYQDLLTAAAATAAPAADPSAASMTLYTSGTTGRPKGVLHSQNSLAALLAQIGEHWEVDPGDAFLVPSPIAHIGGSIYAFEAPLLLGSTAILMDRWDADEAVALIDARQCTHMAGATPFLVGLLAAARRAGTRLPSLKVFICGGASVPPSLIREATDYFAGARVSRVYGSTEVPVTTVGSTDPDGAADTDGRPGIAEIRLVDGEIRARGPQMLLGYRHADDNADAFDADGFFRTGDLGRWENGHVVVTGRAKDLIIRNGENISPKEIEDILIAAPGIAEIAIVGIPDARTGERACAVIVPDGAAATPDVAALAAILDGLGVARFKFPERVEIRDRLPRNDAGKILKHQIRAQLIAAEPTKGCACR